MRALFIRPHDFLAAQMKAWLASLGMVPVVTGELTQLPKFAGADAGVGVISLAVSSSVRATVREATTEVLRLMPALPIVFTSLASHAKVRARIEEELTGLGLGVHTINEPNVSWGITGVALFIAGPEIGTPAATAIARRHLRLAPWVDE